MNPIAYFNQIFLSVQILVLLFLLIMMMIKSLKKPGWALLYWGFFTLHQFYMMAMFGSNSWRVVLTLLGIIMFAMMFIFAMERPEPGDDWNKVTDDEKNWF